MVLKDPTFHRLEPEVELEFGNREALEAAVANALATAGGIDASDVNIVVSDGDRIVLSGTVATVGEIERATVVAQAVEGVRDVRNQILLG
jgi:osmotically-inducible protein OsmY